MRAIALTVSGLLLLTGCSSTGASPEQAVKIIEYEKCLEYQQSLIEETNKEFRELLGLDPGGMVNVYEGQRGRMEILFKKSLENCIPYRP